MGSSLRISKAIRPTHLYIRLLPDALIVNYILFFDILAQCLSDMSHTRADIMTHYRCGRGLTVFDIIICVIKVWCGFYQPDKKQELIEKSGCRSGIDVRFLK